jgi:hypothetical protein
MYDSHTHVMITRYHERFFKVKQGLYLFTELGGVYKYLD